MRLALFCCMLHEHPPKWIWNHPGFPTAHTPTNLGKKYRLPWTNIEYTQQQIAFDDLLHDQSKLVSLDCSIEGPETALGWTEGWPRRYQSSNVDRSHVLLYPALVVPNHDTSSAVDAAKSSARHEHASECNRVDILPGLLAQAKGSAPCHSVWKIQAATQDI